MTASIRFANVSRWTARILGVALLGICVVIAIGEGLPNPLTQPPIVQIGFIALAMVLVGTLAGWMWELSGAAVALAGWLLFVGALRISFHGPKVFIVLLVVPGVLFLVSALLRHFSGKPRAD